MNDAAVFLKAFLEGMPDDATEHFYLWRLGTKQSTWFAASDPESIVQATSWAEPPTNTYVGVSLASEAILLVGAGGNGRSVFLRAVQAFLGRENNSTLSLQRIESERFSSSRLVGKLANICADLPATDLVGSSVFKGITGGDTITAERKYQDSFDFRPSCRLIFSANIPPRTPDAGDAFFDRWVVVPFDRTFRCEVTERPSQALDAELSSPEELSGVLNRAVADLADIRARGISEPMSLVKAREDFRAATDPLSVWLDRELVTVSEGVIPKAQLRDAYNKHAGESGHPNMTANFFGRALSRARPDLRTAQRMVNGRKVVLSPGSASGPLSLSSRTFKDGDVDFSACTCRHGGTSPAYGRHSPHQQGQVV